MIRCKNECPHGQNVCCFFCEKRSQCDDCCEEKEMKTEPSQCDYAIVEATNEVELFQSDVANALIVVEQCEVQKKMLEEKSKKMKEAIKIAMEKHNVKKFTGDQIEITYIAPSVRNTIDSKKLKADYPDVAAECTKTSNVSSSIRIKVK